MADWNKDVPRELEQNLRWRQHVLDAAEKDPALQKHLLRACADDIIFWINTFVWQFNPKRVGTAEELGPFITYQSFQDEFIREIERAIAEQDDRVVEKSRDMGVSWMCLLIMDHQARFHSFKKFLCISRNVDAVDKPNEPDCLFWKLDHIDRYLPDWMKVKRDRLRMSISYPGTNSYITGQASTGKAGVGGRATAAFIDEFSQIDEDGEVLKRTSDTTDCRIFNATHLGVGTAFFNLTCPAENVRPMKKIVLHWSKHPKKNRGLYRYNQATNAVEIIDKEYTFPPDFPFVMDGLPTGGPFPGVRSPWYDAQLGRKGGDARAVAMDLDIDPTGATSQVFNAFTINQLKAEYVRAPVWRGLPQYDHDTGKFIGMMEANSGHLALWIHPRPDGSIKPGRYGLGWDLSNGQGATPSCCGVWDADTGEKVAEYANANISPENLAPLAVALSWAFKDVEGNGARMAWEKGGPGDVFGKQVMRLGYRNVYFKRNEHAMNGAVGDEPGWYPSPNNKILLIRTYMHGLVTRKFINRSEKALSETLEFVYLPNGNIEHGGMKSKTLDPSGAGQNHGDRVVADALGVKMCEELGAGSTVATVQNTPRNSLAWRRELAAIEARDAERWE